MSYKLLLSLLTVCLLATAGCKKDKGGPGNDEDETIGHVTTMVNTQESAVAEYSRVLANTGDSLEAFVTMANWLADRPEISDVTILSELVIELRFTSGLKSHINIIPVNADGSARRRGGGNEPGGDDEKKKPLMLTRTGNNLKTTGDEHLIGNDKVMVFIPFLDEFYRGSGYEFEPLFQEGTKPLDVKVVVNKDADLGQIATFPDYGLIILNTHGLINGFQILTKIVTMDAPHAPGSEVYSEEEIKQHFASSNNLPLDKIESGELWLDMIVLAFPSGVVKCESVVLVTDKYVRNLPRLKDAVVFGNHCYSGHTADGPTTNNMPEAWKSIGAAAYYGYAFADNTSTAVENTFAVSMEEFLIRSLVKDGDSTGVAHLRDNVASQFVGSTKHPTWEGGVKLKVKQNGTKVMFMKTQVFTEDYPPIPKDFFFEHFFDPRYKYGCGTFTDPRDGQVYKLACIGNQTWMAENLRYNAPGSRHIDDNAANGPLYGRLYTWDAVSAGSGVAAPTGPGFRGVCPQGWHVPSKWDFDRLRASLTQKYGSSNSGVQIKAKNSLWVGDPTVGHALRNASGFAALPAGSYSAGFNDKGEAAAFWLSSRYNSTNTNHRALFLVLSTSTEIDGEEGTPDPDDAMSCRCVQD